jgi:hypothetical protein
MNRWECLNDVPEDVKSTMTAAFIPWEKQDLVIENMIDVVLNQAKATELGCRCLRSSANAIRIPELCRIVCSAHSGLSKRNVFKAIGLFTGIHYKNVQKYYYAEKIQLCSK